MAEDGVDVLQERMHFLREAEGITEDEDDEIDERMTILSGRGYDLRLMQMENGNAVLGMWYDDLLEIAKDQRLVILDPLRFLHDADENNNGAMTRFMRIVQQIARLTGATFILLHHTRKGGAGDGEDWAAASGAGAITTAARWQASLRPMNATEAANQGVPDEMRPGWVRLAVDKINYGQQPQPTWLQRTEGGILMHGDTPSHLSEIDRIAMRYERASNGGATVDDLY
ncbi:hypothetical protein Thpro_020674 [Acidihalobacter prosperus]|uniref:DNA helicase n=2 Tax=Acidihalobacter prosperus TaxID=160660 RepID=A0A1A6C8R4_9GAMM|nr:hypothetical protein Thpro_020674 [Acidihalobacter prosperus]